jgi:hypothetical protein
MGYALSFSAFDRFDFNRMVLPETQRTVMISARAGHSATASRGTSADGNPLVILSTAKQEPSRLRRALLSVVRCRWTILAVILALVVWVQTIYGAEPDNRCAILLAGKSGDPDLQKRYLQEIRKLHSLLVGPLGFPRDRVTVLFDEPPMDPDLIQHPSTRAGLEQACLNLSKRVKKADLVFVFIEGHGSYDGKTYKLNLVGSPDPTASELASILYSIPAKRFVVVNATNCSGGSLPALSGEGKIVITATKSGMENNLTHMGQYFVEALENSAADANKDDRVSVIEAFFYTKQKVEDHYKNTDNLQTEHPILDDNGDAEGQSDPSPESKEGLLARTTFFDAGSSLEALKAVTPEQQELELEAREVEKQIETLKYQKAEMPQSDYEKKLEELLLKLARINAKLQK